MLRRVRPGPVAGPIALVLAASLAGCLPYPVGSTAQPLPKGETRVLSSWYIIPNGVALPSVGDSARKAPPIPIRGNDLEFRTGIDSSSDIAVRFPSDAGVIVSYKHRIAGIADSTAPATSVVIGGGFVNLAEHAYAEVGIMHSGRMVDGRVAYGGLRVMQVAPIVEGAVHDRPTAGGFGGVRLPMGAVAISPEVGIYYDHSALGVRRGDLLIVPSVSFSRSPRQRTDHAGDRPLAPPPLGAHPGGGRDSTFVIPGLPRRGRTAPTSPGPAPRPTVRRPTDAKPTPTWVP